MKKLLFLSFLLVATLGTMNAQDFKARTPPDGQTGTERQRDPKARIASQVEELAEGLKLSPEQIVQVTDIFTRSQERMAALRSQGRGEARPEGGGRGARGDRSGMREQMKAIMVETDTEIEAILDKKQLRRYENVKAQRAEQRGQRGGGRPGGNRPDGQ